MAFQVKTMCAHYLCPLTDEHQCRHYRCFYEAGHEDAHRNIHGDEWDTNGGAK